MYIGFLVFGWLVNLYVEDYLNAFDKKIFCIVFFSISIYSQDYYGICRTFHFYQNTKQMGGVELVEVEIHSTCLDDSCFHKYHQIRFLEHHEVGWQFLSHRSGLRCEELRGGGSPPCLWCFIKDNVYNNA